MESHNYRLCPLPECDPCEHHEMGVREGRDLAYAEAVRAMFKDHMIGCQCAPCTMVKDVQAGSGQGQGGGYKPGWKANPVVGSNPTIMSMDVATAQAIMKRSRKHQPLTDAEVSGVMRAWLRGSSLAVLSRKFGKSPTTISKVVNRYREAAERVVNETEQDNVPTRTSETAALPARGKSEAAE